MSNSFYYYFKVFIYSKLTKMFDHNSIMALKELIAGEEE
jgi:hypothetical protein